MRTLPSALEAHLASGVTTLCHCWRLRTHNGQELCFTDHDRDIAFDNSLFMAGSGFDGATAETSLGLASGGTEIAGVLTSESIDERQISAGLYDGARVEIWRVNWADPSQRVLLEVNTIGEVRRSAHAFTAELRSMAHEFDQERGRLFQAQCSADLGDGLCRINLDQQAYTANSIITGGDGRIDFLVDVTGYESGFFDGGNLTILGGVNANLKRTIESHRLTNGAARVRIWERLPQPLEVATAVKLSAGCDKSFATCGAKFSNRLNFRGFPHIPGNDALLSAAGRSLSRMDGGSLNS